MNHIPQFSYYVGYGLGFILASACFALIGAFLVQISTRVVVDFRPLYREAWNTACAVILISGAIRVAVTAIIGGPLDTNTRILLPLGLFCVQSAISGQLLRHPETGTIGFGKGLLVTLTQWIIALGCFCLLILCVPKGVSKFIFNAATYRNLHSSWPTYPTAHNRTTRISQTPSPSEVQPVGRVQKIQESQKEAVRLYPELSVAGSAFNKEFVARYTRYKKERPGYFFDPTWPLCLAQETDDALHPK